MAKGKPSVRPQAIAAIEAAIIQAENDNRGEQQDPALLLLAGTRTPSIQQAVQGNVATVLSEMPQNLIPEAEQSHIRLKSPLLGKNAESAPEAWRQSVLAIGDLDSDAHGLLEILERSGYIESEPNPDGEGILIEPTVKALTSTTVQTGDIFDRGSTLIPTLDIFTTLKEAGADLRITAGNHDTRALYAFTSPSVLEEDPLFYRLLKETHAAWEQDPSRKYLAEVAEKVKDDERYTQALFDACSFWNWYITTGYPVMTELRARFFPEGENPKIREVLQKGAELFLNGGPYAKFMKSMSFLEQIDDVLYLHGGINDWLADELDKKGLKDVNAEFQQSYGTPSFAHYGYGEPCQPLWMRYQVLTPKAAKVVKKMGVRAIVRGHDTQTNGTQLLTQEHGISIIHNDVGIMLGNRSAVAVSPLGEMSAIREEGTPKKILVNLPKNPPKRRDSLIKKLRSAL